MANINKILLMGRLTADPELKHTASNIAVVAFTIAVNRKINKENEQSQADFIDIVCWRQTAEFVCKYFTKGKPIFISGALQTRMWEDKEGKKRKAVEVLADEVSFAETKTTDNTQSKNDNYTPNNQNNSPSFAKSNDDFISIDNDELPF